MQSSYLRPAINGTNINLAANKIVNILINFGLDKFDSIAFRGVSGALVAPMVAALTGKNLIIVRKEGENAHSRYKVEGDKESKAYIIIDDFIDNGETVRVIIKDISEKLSKTTIPVLMVNYMDDDDSTTYQKHYMHGQLKQLDFPIINFNIENEVSI